MSDIVAYEFVKQYFSDEIAQSASDIIDDIQIEVQEQIKKADWLCEDLREHALEKSVYMKKLIGYPNWYRNESTVERYFHNLDIGSSYHENYINYTKYSQMKRLKSLMEGDSEYTSWQISPVTLNALYTSAKNTIIMPAASFQGLLFSLNRPAVFNYGFFGNVMAHEINHAFGDNSIYYDKYGNMNWKKPLGDTYNDRVMCFYDRFHKIGKEKYELDERYAYRSLGENMVDVMGIQAAFRAYKRRTRQCSMPGLTLSTLERYNEDQLFFLAFANLYCEKINEEYKRKILTSDRHSANVIRVIGSVSNSKDFARTFDCPVGSPMNPEKKCDFWG